MSETILKILLEELKTVRLVCKACNRGVIEVSIERFGEALNKGECRFCQTAFFPSSGPGAKDPFNSLRLAIADLLREDRLGIEFIIRQPEKQPDAETR
jgi:hypothetical protein